MGNNHKIAGIGSTLQVVHSNYATDPFLYSIVEIYFSYGLNLNPGNTPKRVAQLICQCKAQFLLNSSIGVQRHSRSPYIKQSMKMLSLLTFFSFSIFNLFSKHKLLSTKCSILKFYAIKQRSKNFPQAKKCTFLTENLIICACFLVVFLGLPLLFCALTFFSSHYFLQILDTLLSST